MYSELSVFVPFLTVFRFISGIVLEGERKYRAFNFFTVCYMTGSNANAQ